MPSDLYSFAALLQPSRSAVSGSGLFAGMSKPDPAEQAQQTWHCYRYLILTGIRRRKVKRGTFLVDLPTTKLVPAGINDTFHKNWLDLGLPPAACPTAFPSPISLMQVEQAMATEISRELRHCTEAEIDERLEADPIGATDALERAHYIQLGLNLLQARRSRPSASNRAVMEERIEQVYTKARDIQDPKLQLQALRDLAQTQGLRQTPPEDMQKDFYEFILRLQRRKEAQQIDPPETPEELIPDDS